ncbi:MAG: hypothetical protein P8188_16995, partial [Gemmatimonadota bacterium]
MRPPASSTDTRPSGLLAAILDGADDDPLLVSPERVWSRGAYNADGVRHMIHVYFEQGTFEAEGTPANGVGFDLTAGT